MSFWRRSCPPLGGKGLSLMARVFLCLSLFAPQMTLAEQPDATALQRLVHQDCGSCHGLLLKGGLGPDLRVEAIEHYDSEGLTSVILDGIEGTAMPPWRPLMSQAEADWIAQYLLKGDYR